MDKEKKWAREPFARMINDRPDMCWIPQYNLQWQMYGKKGLDGESGKPDGSVHLAGGTVSYVEFKADEGSLDLSCLRDNQRDWWRNCCLPYNTPYYVAAWVAEERGRARANHDRASFFLVPIAEWIALEQEALSRFGTKTVALSAELQRIGVQKSLTLRDYWYEYALERSGGKWHIPSSHPFTSPLRLYPNLSQIA